MFQKLWKQLKAYWRKKCEYEYALLLLVRTSWHHVDFSHVHFHWLHRHRLVGGVYMWKGRKTMRRLHYNMAGYKPTFPARRYHSLHRVSLAAAKCQQSLEEGRGSVKVLGSVRPSAPLQSWVAPGQPESSVQLAAGGDGQMWHVWRRMRGAAESVSGLQPWDAANIPANLQVETRAKCCRSVWGKTWRL